jgi:LemA protein
MITLNEDIDAKWAQVENDFQRRFDLIPNLVETVKRYAEHEEEIFTNIAEARSRIGSAQTPGDKMKAEGELGGFLSRLLMITENYPNLKANEQFQQLQAQLEGTENRIAVERKRYNESVQSYNTTIKKFPGKFYAMIGGFEPREFFEATSDAQQAPQVDFGNKQ